MENSIPRVFASHPRADFRKTAMRRGRVKTVERRRGGGVGDEAKDASCSGSDGFHHRFGSEHCHHPLHIVELISVFTLGRRLIREWVWTSQALWVFDQTSPFAHGSRPQVHPSLERIDHRFLLPPCDLRSTAGVH